MNRDSLMTVATLGVSLLGHVLFLQTEVFREHPQASHPRPIEVTMVRPPPPKPPLPPPPPPKPKVKVKPPPPPVVTKPVPVPPPPPPNAPPPEPPPKPIATPVRPVFGISMTSVVGGGSFAVPVGNTLMTSPTATRPSADVKPYSVIPAHRVTRMPHKRGDCQAVYPPEARQLGIEGKVTLDVEVRPDGSVGDVQVISGLGHGLDEAATAALKHCKFDPAQLAGEDVATRIQYVYTFLIED